MKCPKCSGLRIYEPPSFQGDVGSMRCLNCGERQWEAMKVVIPEIPPLEKDRSYATGASNLAKARETKLSGIAARRNQLMLHMAQLDKEARLAG
jgi:hypothetical protein